MIFDVGGVLAHNMWEPMFDDLAREHGLDPAKVQEAGRLLWETFAYVPETPANTWRDMERRYWELFLRMFKVPLTVDALIARTDRYVVPMQGMRPILERLHARGTRMVICSNNNEIWWPRQAKALRAGSLFHPGKPSSCRPGWARRRRVPRLEMFRAAVAAAGVPAANCFFTDDRQPIVDCARAFGIDAMLFRGPEHFATELRKRDLL